MRVTVSKVGGVLYMPDAAKKASSVGEQGETPSVLRRLVHLGHDVTYYGSLRGTPPAGVRVVDPIEIFGSEHVTEWSTKQEQDAYFLTGEAALGEQDVFVHVLGMEGSSCYVDNAFGAQVQASDVRYCSAQLHACRGKPRICIINDPRSFPKLQEQTTIWKDTLPWAILSQQESSRNRILGGKPVHERQVYAGAENWWTSGLTRPDVSGPRRWRSLVVAHAHIATGCKQRRRDDAWSSLHDGFQFDAVYGQGWVSFSGYDSNVHHPPVRPSEVPKLLLSSMYQPCVSPQRAFYTGKVTMSAWHGCAPIFYGRGEEFSYDYDQRYIDWRDPRRAVNGRELRTAMAEIGDPLKYCDWMLEMCRPDWQLFDDCVTDAGRGVHNERYGGMWLR